MPFSFAVNGGFGWSNNGGFGFGLNGASSTAAMDYACEYNLQIVDSTHEHWDTNVEQQKLWSSPQDFDNFQSAFETNCLDDVFNYVSMQWDPNPYQARTPESNGHGYGAFKAAYEIQGFGGKNSAGWHYQIV